MGSYITLCCFTLFAFVKSQKILETKTTFRSLRCCEDTVERLENDQLCQRQEIINRNIKIEEYQNIILERDKLIKELQQQLENKNTKNKELEGKTKELSNFENGKQGHKGAEFWLAFPENYIYRPPKYSSSVRFGLVALSISNTTVIKMVNQTRITKTDTLIHVEIDNTFMQRKNQIEHKGLSLKANSDISLYSSSSRGVYNVDVSWIPPVDKLGTDYIAVSYHPYYRADSYISITALHADTSVNITLNTTGALSYNGKTFHSGDKVRIHLSKFYTILLSHRNDLTGSRVSSNRPISVQSGDTALSIGNIREHTTYSSIFLPPLHTWGRTFVIPPIKTAIRMIIRVVPSVPNTVITISADGGNESYSRNDTLELNLAATDMFIVHCDKPCFVAQFAVSKPDYSVICYMTTVPATEQYSHEYYMLSFHKTGYVTIMIKSDEKDGLLLDKSTIFDNNTDMKSLNISGQQWSVITVLVQQEGIHRIGHTSSHILYGAIAYGFGYKMSYAYALGLNI